MHFLLKTFNKFDNATVRAICGDIPGAKVNCDVFRERFEKSYQTGRSGVCYRYFQEIVLCSFYNLSFKSDRL